MQASAFVPFYRNHNQRGALSQEPYRWDSVAEASRVAMAIRYSLLPYWVDFKPRNSFQIWFTNLLYMVVHLVRERVHVWNATCAGSVLRIPQRARIVQCRFAMDGWE